MTSSSCQIGAEIVDQGTQKFRGFGEEPLEDVVVGGVEEWVHGRIAQSALVLCCPALVYTG
jgi:hypothetical protein